MSSSPSGIQQRIQQRKAELSVIRSELRQQRVLVTEVEVGVVVAVGGERGDVVVAGLVGLSKLKGN